MKSDHYEILTATFGHLEDGREALLYTLSNANAVSYTHLTLPTKA